MRRKSTLKRDKRFRQRIQRTHKKSVYGGMPTLSYKHMLMKNSPTPEMMMRAYIKSAVAIDCEMVGVGPDGKENALAHVAIVDFNGDELYNTYVMPSSGINSITDYRTKYSGITKEVLEGPGVKSFDEVKEEVKYILDGRIIVGHGLINDFKVLDYTPDPNMVWDTTMIDAYLQNGPVEFMANGTQKVKRISRKLKALAKEIAGNDIQMPDKVGHSPLEDARASMNLYRVSVGYFKIQYEDMSK